MRAIDLLYSHFKSYSAIAREIGTSYQLVQYWHKTEKADLPLEFYKDAAQSIGIHPSDLRPDIFRDSQ